MSYKKFLNYIPKMKMEEILILSDKMMAGKISVYEYIKKITGHNIQQFLNKKLKIIKVSKLKKIGKDKGVLSNKKTIEFHYIKIELSYQNGKKSFTKLIEIDILREKDKYIVCGFMI